MCLNSVPVLLTQNVRICWTGAIFQADIDNADDVFEASDDTFGQCYESCPQAAVPVVEGSRLRQGGVDVTIFFILSSIFRLIQIFLHDAAS